MPKKKKTEKKEYNNRKQVQRVQIRAKITEIETKN